MNGLNGQAIGIYTPPTVTVTGAGTSVPNTTEEINTTSGIFTRTIPLISTWVGQDIEYVLVAGTNQVNLTCSGSDKMINSFGAAQTTATLFEIGQWIKLHNDGTNIVQVG